MGRALLQAEKMRTVALRLGITQASGICEQENAEQTPHTSARFAYDSKVTAIDVDARLCPLDPPVRRFPRAMACARILTRWVRGASRSGTPRNSASPGFWSSPLATSSHQPHHWHVHTYDQKRLPIQLSKLDR